MNLPNLRKGRCPHRPKGNCEFAGDFRINGAFRRDEVGIVPNAFMERRVKLKIRRIASQNKKKTTSRNQSFYGAGDEARTRYLHLGKVALYRMSYTRITQMQVSL